MVSPARYLGKRLFFRVYATRIRADRNKNDQYARQFCATRFNRA